MQNAHPTPSQRRQPKFPPAPFSVAESATLDWFRQRYWEAKAGALLSDETIAYMLLRVALGNRESLAGWLDALIAYRDAEGVNLSDLIERRISAASQKASQGSDVPEPS